MKGNRAVLTVVVVAVALLLGWWLFGRGGNRGTVDLIDRFADAQKRPAGDVFAIEDVTLGSESKKAIALKPAAGTRLTWKVRVPDNGWLWVSVGMKPEAWEKEGNGVYFFAGVSDTRAFEKLFEQTLNPFKNPSERRWISVMVDLSAYAGEDMEVILNTRASAGGQPPDDRNDLPLWGAPEIVRR